MAAPPTPEWMLAEARTVDKPVEHLVAVADHWIAKWTDLADQVAAGADLDGRTNIYTGETYAEGRDRWTTYRGLLLATKENA